MNAILWDLVANQLAPALVFYLIVWFSTNKKDGKKIKINGAWHIFGVFLSAFIAGVLRLASIFVVGGETALNSQGGSTYGIFFFIILPIIIALGVTSLIRTKGRYVS
ncbi:MAG TPA: hypothetical protein PKL42_06100 [Methylotenera sp.]|nr:hypothetical protein [Methylotenera sp.]HPV31180.1 hypothetical protein [Methylotenera sp.]